MTHLFKELEEGGKPSVYPTYILNIKFGHVRTLFFLYDNYQ